MQKRFIKAASIVIIIAMAATVLVAYALQTMSALQQSRTKLDSMLSEVTARLAENDLEIAALKESLNADYLARARGFSYMLAQNPAMLEQPDVLSGILEVLDVDELHVTDSDGVIRWGTVPDYYGFDMASSEQAGEFMPILNDPSLEIAQEPQPNGTKGILFQYISVSRRDQPGIVQIGMQPTRLENALKNNEIGNVLERYHTDDSLVFALDKADGAVLWHPDANLIGKTADEIGVFPDANAYLGTYRTGRVNGQKLRLSAVESGDMLLVAQMDYHALMAGRNTQAVVLVISDLMIVFVIVAAISLLLKKQISLPITNIVASLHKIEAGDLETAVSVRDCPEFILLSDGINAMVSSIKAKIDESETLLSFQQQAAAQVQQTVGELRRLSDSNLATANNLAGGATEQAASMQELAASISTLADLMQRDQETAVEAGQTSTESGALLHEGMQELERLNDAMLQMNRMSGEIQSVVKAIDDISFQTNILALNAAVEAARAGTAGKGFAVVADEVRNLAGKSAESARKTAEMIGHTIDLMQNGQSISDQAANRVRDAIVKAEQANQLTCEIEQASKRQMQTVLHVRASGEEISKVIQSNSSLAEESREGVTGLLGAVQKLEELSTRASALEEKS